MVFANIEYLFLLLLLIPYIVWYIMKRTNSEATLQISDARVYAHTPKSYKNYLLHVPFVLRIIALILIILVLARPQTTDSWQNSEIEGIDIMLAMDVSTSMLAEDLKPNRLEAAKDVAAEFINGRPNDNIGITLFAGESFTQCPLTVDHAVLLNLLKDMKCGLIEDGTAIGMGIANAVTRLKDSKAKSKVIILLTDGVNNKGDISTLTAAEFPCHQQLEVEGSVRRDRQAGENKIECKRIQQAPGRVPLVCVGCFLVRITGGTVTQLYIEEDTVKTENVF